MIWMCNADGDGQYVADALIPSYRAKGYMVEGEEQETVPPDSVDKETAAPSENPGVDTGARSTDGENQLREYICPICGKEYKTPAGLEAHIEAKHSGQ